MILTYREALAKYGSRYQVRKAVSDGELFTTSRNLYMTDEGDMPDELSLISRLHPGCYVTGRAALYLHGLIDTPPESIELAAKRGGSKISQSGITPRYVQEDALLLGATEIEHEDSRIPIYDLERMLLELVKDRNKMPYDLYREAISAYRKRADELDIYKLQDYAKGIPRGEFYLETAMREVF